MHRHRLFGLTLASELALPGAVPADPTHGGDDMVIHYGHVPAGPGELSLIAPHEAILTVDGVARYRVTNGATIVIAPAPGADAAEVRLFLLGSAMAVALHQRRRLVLHASVLVRSGRAWAFVGPSGSGKSTIAAALIAQGWTLLSDDLGAIDAGMVMPGLARARLWPDALHALGKAPADYPLSVAGDPAYDKRDVPMPLGAAMALAGICLIHRGDVFEVIRLDGMAAFAALHANLYRGEWLRIVGDPAAITRQLAAVTTDIRLWRLQLRNGLDHLPDDLQRWQQACTAPDGPLATRQEGVAR